LAQAVPVPANQLSCTMAPLTLHVRPTKAVPPFTVEVEDDESVEALSVVIYSVKPELGLDLRLVHKGQLLKYNDIIKDVNIQDGDPIAVARAPISVSEAASTPPQDQKSAPSGQDPAVGAADMAVESEQTMAEAAAPAITQAEQKLPADNMSQPIVAPTQVTPAEMQQDPIKQVEQTHQEPLHKADICQDQTIQAQQTCQEQLQTSGMEQDQKTLAEGTCQAPTQVADDLVAKDMLGNSSTAMDVDKSTAGPTSGPIPDEQPSQHESTFAEALTAPPATESVASPESVQEQPSESQQEQKVVSSSMLHAMAQQLESTETESVNPSELAQLFRGAATRMEALETAASDFARALQMVNIISATAMRGADNENQSSAPREEGTRSFLIKKGDTDLHDAHKSAATFQRQLSGASTCSGGSLSSSATPMTRQEMDVARQARVARLEAQQAEKKRQLDEAEARERSRESLLKKPFVGPAKPLGKI